MKESEYILVKNLTTLVNMQKLIEGLLGGDESGLSKKAVTELYLNIESLISKCSKKIGMFEREKTDG